MQEWSRYTNSKGRFSADAWRVEMKIGMLWFDADRETDLNHRIERAVTYYRNKYGSAPEICVSHPTTIEDGANKRIAGVRIERSSSVLPDHFWLGIEEE